jgi:hypothetical protein
MSDVRRRITRRIADDPGIHVNQLDLAAGQVQFHLRRLTDADAVAAAALFGRTHYYPPGYDAWEHRALALVRREPARISSRCCSRRAPHGPSTSPTALASPGARSPGTPTGSPRPGYSRTDATADGWSSRTTA